jgi:hypothetical protein
VRAHDLLGPLGHGGDRGDRDRRGVGRQHGILAGDPVEVAEDLLLDLDLFEHRLDDQVHLGRRVQVGGHGDASEGGVALVGRHGLLVDHPGERPFDGRDSPIECVGRDIANDDVPPGNCRHLGDARPHQPCSDHQHPAHGPRA